MAEKRNAGSGSTPPRDPDDAGGDYNRQGDGEQQGGVTMGVAVISGTTFAAKSVVYYEVNGMAIVEGDIALGSVEEVRAATDQAREAVSAHPESADEVIAFGVGLPAGQKRWPGCLMPYEIDPALPNQQRVTDAIAHWEANTPFRFPRRTAANAAKYPNYVRFTDADGCWSRVGMQGGQQLISLGPRCSTGNAIHEIGHAAGLWHEQSREDRDLFVRINWQNIQSNMAAQFNQHITDGDDLGAYDYGSIMHYPRDAFSKNGQDTITPLTTGVQIGQRTGLSAGDIAALRAMYPACTVKNPLESVNLKALLDLRVVESPVKRLRDGQLKPIRDLKPPRDPGVVKGGRDPINVGFPGAVAQPGTLRPFSMATPHHAAAAMAMGAGAAGTGAASAYLGGMEQELLELDASIAEAVAIAARATADAARLQDARDAVASVFQDVLGQERGG